MQSMIRSIFVLFLLGFFTVASAQLPPEIRADAYLLQAEQAIRNGDLHRAQAAIQNILRLQKEHELDLSDEFLFRYAKAADAVDLSEQALEAVLKYLVASGREGQHYVEALTLMNKTKDRSSGDVVASQLSPNIIADAYLLQTEQSIRDGDRDHARTVIQNIRNLQEQHELDLPDEFHYRYAKAADALDLSEQALESVVKYLAVSGREGQHYLEALALMNKVQTAVSCKGWDTEDYFKTATLEEVTACLDTGVDLNARDDAGATPLHRAVENTENPNVFKVLLNAGANPNARDNNKWTPLHYAVALGKNTGVIEILLNAGADIEAQSKDKQTPLFLAVLFKRPAAIKVLSEAGADRTRVKDKWTSLHWAATYNENPVAIQSLLNAGADPNAKDDDKQTPLHIAARFGNLVAIQSLLNAGADPKAKDDDKRMPLHFAAWDNENPDIVKALFEAETGSRDREKNRWSLLHHAAKYNKNPGDVKALIEGGADPDAQDPSFKQTPLHRAVYNENPDILKVLIEAGADLKKRTDNGFTPLHYAAAFNENPDMVKVLIEAGADLKATDNTLLNRVKLKERISGDTPLHLAARSNKNADVTKVLLNAGADPNKRDLWGDTPLHDAAAFNKNADVAKVLLNAGADPNRRDAVGNTPLHGAAKYNENPDVVKVLINAGANLGVRAYGDSTPLHLAAESNENPDVIRILLSAGADLNAENKKGFTPLGLAVEKNKSPDVVRILRAAGASQTKIAGKSQEGDGFGKAAAALLGGAAIMYAGKDAADQEAVTEAVRQYMEGVLTDQPGGSGNTNSAAMSSQTQGGQAQDPMQQALQNLENVCGEKYQGISPTDEHNHGRFYCLAAFNDYCALKRAQSSEAISKLRTSLQQNCTVLKRDGLDGQCPYCKYGNENTNPVTTQSQAQGRRAQDSMQQTLQNFKYTGFAYMRAECGKMQYSQISEMNMMIYDYYFSGVFDYSGGKNVFEGNREKYENFLREKYRVTECIYVNVYYFRAADYNREKIEKILEDKIKDRKQNRSDDESSVIVDPYWKP